jgi:Protein of unknown function (DUF3995)
MVPLSSHSVPCTGRHGPSSSGACDRVKMDFYLFCRSLSAREAARRDATMIAGAAAVVILLLLAAVHVYWAAGGKAGKAAAIPTAEGRAVLKPSALSTAMVAVALCVIAAILALRIGWIKLPSFAGDNILVQIAAWLIAAVFALRAIGDFRYVGFFKRIRYTRFARLDTLAYSPLCAVLAVLIGIAASH